MNEKRTIRVFRVSGILPNWNTAYVDAALRNDAPDEVFEAMRKMVRDHFTDRHPDAIRVEVHEWTQETGSDD